MWNWGAHGMQHCGQVIIVNPRGPDAAQRLGWEIAPSIDEAIGMARSRQGESASISVIHSPPIAMWEVE
jgi:hypothetical protein